MDSGADGGTEDRELAQSLQAARSLLQAATRVVVLTGAGISTDSGISDFRGPDGLWTKETNLEATFSLSAFLQDPAARRVLWERLLKDFSSAAPNSGHLALSSFRRSGRLQLLVTQNVDGLHEAAGHEDDKVIAVHGSLARVQCLYCFTRHSTQRMLRHLGPPDGDAAYEPRCPRCSGLLKPDVVLFGEALQEDALKQCLSAAETCDLLLCVGSTLSVAPVNEMVARAKNANAAVVIVNGSPTQFDHLANVVVRAPIAVALPQVLSSGESDRDLLRGFDRSESVDSEDLAWKFNGFSAWLPEEQLLGMDALSIQAWSSHSGLPDWPPAVYHGSADHPVFRRVTI